MFIHVSLETLERNSVKPKKEKAREEENCERASTTRQDPGEILYDFRGEAPSYEDA